MAFVYILQCADDTLYTGWTTDIERRILEHNTSKKGSRYTRARRPVRLVYTESIADNIAAMQREAQIKKLSRMQKLQLIKDKTRVTPD
ncbi:MAG: GIY-YIG nuclease family protein [Eubacteriales bacterium]